MLQYAIKVSLDTASPALRRMLAALKPATVAKLSGRIAANRVRGHLEGLASTRHRSYMPHSYYATAARMTSGEVDGDTCRVVVAGPAGIRLHYYGGVVKPSGRISAKTGKPITRLAIPRRPEAEQRTPADFDDLFLWKSKIVGRAGLARRSPNGRLEIYYWLVASVTMKEDHGVLPPLDELGKEINDAIGSSIIRVAKARLQRQGDAS